MRTFIRNQVIEIIDSVKEGIEYTRSAPLKSALSVLNDCFDVMNVIESTIKNNFSEIQFLYYRRDTMQAKEVIEQIYLLIQEDKPIDQLANDLINNLSAISEKLCKEENIRYEVVFMPYNASMWDCMESIWSAASKDPMVDCYVIPIPYYDKNPDGTLGTKYYEAAKLPSYVPLVDYNNYDIAARRPDVVYIHNPYDEYNRATTVDPKFYSHELKKYTEMLVYVPYYIANEFIPESQLLASGNHYADRIILGSRKQKETYPKLAINSKFIALGSPKIDRVLYYENNKPQLPDEWSQIIQDKKVILFNTSLQAILTKGIQVIEHLKYVFEIFKNRTDVVLWWRPHPLSQQLIYSMRPELLPDYVQIENYFSTNKLGIFDTNSDVSRAIASSDAYYGDPSSMIHLFACTGKPVMMHNVDITRMPSAEEINSVWFPSLVIDQDFGWFVEGETNYLSKVHLQTGVVSRVIAIPNENSYAYYQYNITEYQRYLVLVPFNANEIAIYNRESCEIKKISVKRFDYETKGKFSSAVVYGEHIYFIPYQYDAIVRYDIETEELVYFNELYRLIESDISLPNDVYFEEGAERVDNKLYIPCAQTNGIIEYDMITGECNLFKIGEQNSRYRGIKYANNSFWIIQKIAYNQEVIVKWNILNNSLREYNVFPDDFIHTKQFQQLVVMDNELFIFPRYSNQILRLDMETGIADTFGDDGIFKLNTREKMQFTTFTSLWSYLASQKIEENEILTLSTFDNSLMRINLIDANVTFVRLQLDSTNSVEDRYSETDPKVNKLIDCFYKENLYFTLTSFIDYICSNDGKKLKFQQDVYSNFYENSDGTSGEKIHQYIMGSITNPTLRK